MSATEMAQLMKEAGFLSGAGGSSSSTVSGDGNRIQVEHILVLDLSDKWENIIKGIAVGGLNLGRHLVDSLRIVAIGCSIGVVLWGTSRLIASMRGRSNTRLQMDDTQP